MAFIQYNYRLEYEEISKLGFYRVKQTLQIFTLCIKQMVVLGNEL